MGIEFPITAAAMLTIAGVAIFASLVGTWLKGYLGDWRWTNLLVLAVAIIAAICAQCVVGACWPPGEALFTAILIGFFGASLATYGHETIQNLLGMIGVGRRSDAAQIEQARVVLAKAECKVIDPTAPPGG